MFRSLHPVVAGSVILVEIFPLHLIRIPHGEHRLKTGTERNFIIENICICDDQTVNIILDSPVLFPDIPLRYLTDNLHTGKLQVILYRITHHIRNPHNRTIIPVTYEFQCLRFDKCV